MTVPVQYSIDNKPYCEKCKRIVNRWSVKIKYDIVAVPRSWNSLDLNYQHTGYDTLILKIECHGESFEATYHGDARLT